MTARVSRYLTYANIKAGFFSGLVVPPARRHGMLISVFLASPSLITSMEPVVLSKYPGHPNDDRPPGIQTHRCDTLGIACLSACLSVD